MNLSKVEQKNQASAMLAAEILYKGLARGNLTQEVKEMNEMINEWVEGKRWAKRTVRRYAVEAIEDCLNGR